MTIEELKSDLSNALIIISDLMVHEDYSPGDEMSDCMWCNARCDYDIEEWTVPHRDDCAWNNARKFLIETRKKMVADSLDNSLKENSEIWKEMANHVRAV